ncbi:MAG TPA: histidinol dehydrogenase, partial [Xanthobacteraceae bacterium]
MLDAKREASTEVEAAVRAIVNDVARRGDAAVQDYTLKFDQLDLADADARVPAEEIAAAVRSCSRDALDALELAQHRIET